MKHNKNIKYAPVKTEYCGPCCLSFTVARSEATLLCFCLSQGQRGFFVLAHDSSCERGSLGPRCLLPALCARASRHSTYAACHVELEARGAAVFLFH